MAVRLPDEATVRRAEKMEARGEAGGPNRWEYILKVDGALKLYRRFKDNPFDAVPVHAVRIGDLAIATNPFEMYCRFGRDIRSRSASGVTMISQLTDGFCGYCPTIYGVLGGGYSGEPIYWCRLESAAGYKIVDVSARLLHELWRD